MIVLDTNVLSAAMRRKPEEVVIAWLDRQSPESLWITTITVFEVRFGIELLAPGRRRRQIEEAFTRALDEDFEGRILPFDQAAARETALLAARRCRADRPVEFRDTQIAGIVTARRATLATHNTKHYQDLSITVIDPWVEG